MKPSEPAALFAALGDPARPRLAMRLSRAPSLSITRLASRAGAPCAPAKPASSGNHRAPAIALLS